MLLIKSSEKNGQITHCLRPVTARAFEVVGGLERDACSEETYKVYYVQVNPARNKQALRKFWEACLFICLFIHLFICLFVCLFIYFNCYSEFFTASC